MAASQHPSPSPIIRSIFINYSTWNKVQWFSSSSINFSVIQPVQIDVFNSTDLDSGLGFDRMIVRAELVLTLMPMFLVSGQLSRGTITMLVPQLVQKLCSLEWGG